MVKTEADYISQIDLIRSSILFYEEEISKGSKVAEKRQRVYLDDLDRVLRNYHAWCRKHSVVPYL